MWSEPNVIRRIPRIYCFAWIRATGAAMDSTISVNVSVLDMVDNDVMRAVVRFC